MYGGGVGGEFQGSDSDIEYIRWDNITTSS